MLAPEIYCNTGFVPWRGGFNRAILEDGIDCRSNLFVGG
jgi:hypothetical protein